MIPQTKQLYEAAKNVWKVADKINAKANGLSVLVPDEDFCALMRSIHELSTASSAYEQEQPEAIAGEKTKDAVAWLVNNNCGDLVLNIGRYSANTEANAKKWIYASDAMESYSSAKDKEIAELKEAISELIQVKDWKDKYGKDEHYLKAMPIAWENVRKLIQK